jgi:hypothetical protein
MLGFAVIFDMMLVQRVEVTVQAVPQPSRCFSHALVYQGVQS